MARCIKKLESFEKEMRQLRLLVDEVRRGVAAYGITPGGSARAGTDGEPAGVSNVIVYVCMAYAVHEVYKST